MFFLFFFFFRLSVVKFDRNIFLYVINRWFMSNQNREFNTDLIVVRYKTP